MNQYGQLAVLLLLLAFTLNVATSFGVAIPVHSVAPADSTTPIAKGDNDPLFIDAKSYASFAAAVSAIGATPTTLNISSALTVARNLTVPSTCTLRFVGAGKLTIITGFTLTINGDIVADPRRQIFANALPGQGSVLPVSVSTLYPQWWGARANGVNNDTLPIKAAGTAVRSGMTLDFTYGTYKVLLTEETSLITFTSKDGIFIRGKGATIHDTTAHSFTPANPFTAIFTFDKSKNIDVRGLNFLGPMLAAPATDLGYKGATFIYAKNGSENITVDAYLENLRYGVASGSYSDQTVGNNKGFALNLRTKACGYPTAHYLAENVHGTIVADSTHRSAYLAGVIGVDLRVFFKNQFIADCQVLLTDAKTGTGTSRGCKDVNVEALDMGSTTYVTPSWAVGLSPSRMDPNTTFENINVSFNVRGTDTIATKLGGFILNSQGTGYPTDWVPSYTLRNIRIRGIVDRVGQTIIGNPVGEIYFFATDATNTNFPTVDNIRFDGVIIKDASTPNTRDNYFVATGLQHQATFSTCDFSGVGLLVSTNTTSTVSFIDSAVRYTNPDPSERSKIELIDTVVGDIRKQP